MVTQPLGREILEFIKLVVELLTLTAHNTAAGQVPGDIIEDNNNTSRVETRQI